MKQIDEQISKLKVTGGSASLAHTKKNYNNIERKKENNFICNDYNNLHIETTNYIHT